MSVILLNAVTATGVGQSFQNNNGFVSHTVQVMVTGSPTVVVVDLEGSLNGVTWFQLQQYTFDAADITAQAALFHQNDKLVDYVRLNLITLTGGTAPTVVGLWTGF